MIHFVLFGEMIQSNNMFHLGGDLPTTLVRINPLYTPAVSGELQGREAEVLTVTRDTTEADLKQRRELSRCGVLVGWVGTKPRTRFLLEVWAG